jgi:hypothetical protein
MSQRKWRFSNEGKLERLKTKGQSLGWSLMSITDTEIRLIKTERNNCHLTIDGEMEFIYNVVTHSVTTKLNHNGTIKTLVRYINPEVWKPIETILAYPRTHSMPNNLLNTSYI